VFAATLAIVIAFACWAVYALQRGRLRSAPPIGRATGAGAALGAAAYVALATWPLWRALNGTTTARTAPST